MSEQPTRIEQRGLWFDELDLDALYVHRPGRTMTEADNISFSTTTLNPQGLHIDAAYSATQPFGRPLMNSMFTLATIVGMSVAHLTRGTIVANLGFDSVTFPAPLFNGDTLYGETSVEGLRISKSHPGAGIATLKHIGRNQDDDVVAVALRNVLMLRNPEAGNA